MKLEVELELRDVFGGDSFTRPIRVKATKLNRRTTQTRAKSSLGVKVKDSTDENKEEEKDDVVLTFRGLENGLNGIRPQLRVGGLYGKFWGALRAAGKRLASFGDPEFKSMAAADRIVFGIDVSPMWVELDGSIIQRTLPQKLNGGRGGMIFQHYDVVESCKTRVVLEYPDLIDEHVRKLLKAVQQGGHFNKRRAIITVASISEVKEVIHPD